MDDQNNSNSNIDNIFEYQEFYLQAFNIIHKIIVCKKNEEVIIKSNKYELFLNYNELSTLTKLKFLSIDEAYNYLINLFDENKIVVKSILINKSIQISFNEEYQNKDIELCLIYNKRSKNILFEELNSTIKSLKYEIEKLKKENNDLKELIKNEINNKENENKIENNSINLNYNDIHIYKDFVVNNTKLMLEKEIENAEKISIEYEKKADELNNLAKDVLKKGNKEKAKKILKKKNTYIDLIKTIEGILALMENQKLMLDTSSEMRKVICSAKFGINSINESIKEQHQKLDEIKNAEKKVDEMPLKIEKKIIDDDEKEIKKEMEEFFKKIEILQKSLQKGIYANIISFDGMNVEDLKCIKNQMEIAQKKEKEITDFLESYNKEKNKELEEFFKEKAIELKEEEEEEFFEEIEKEIEEENKKEKK